MENFIEKVLRVVSSLLVIQENSTADPSPFFYGFFLQVKFYKMSSEATRPVQGGQNLWGGAGGRGVASMFGLAFPRIAPKSLENALI